MEITLKAARVNKGLTQSEAAKELGTSSRTIYLWEKGKCFPNALQINKIEKLYGVSYNEIIFCHKMSSKPTLERETDERNQSRKLERLQHQICKC